MHEDQRPYLPQQMPLVVKIVQVHVGADVRVAPKVMDGIAAPPRHVLETLAVREAGWDEIDPVMTRHNAEGQRREACADLVGHPLERSVLMIKLLKHHTLCGGGLKSDGTDAHEAGVTLDEMAGTHGCLRLAQ